MIAPATREGGWYKTKSGARCYRKHLVEHCEPGSFQLTAHTGHQTRYRTVDVLVVSGGWLVEEAGGGYRKLGEYADADEALDVAETFVTTGKSPKAVLQ